MPLTPKQEHTETRSFNWPQKLAHKMQKKPQHSVHLERGEWKYQKTVPEYPHCDPVSLWSCISVGHWWNTPGPTLTGAGLTVTHTFCHIRGMHMP